MYTIRQNMTTGRWAVVQGHTIILGNLAEIEAKAIALELNTHPDNPWA